MKQADADHLIFIKGFTVLTKQPFHVNIEQ